MLSAAVLVGALRVNIRCPLLILISVSFSSLFREGNESTVIMYMTASSNFGLEELKQHIYYSSEGAVELLHIEYGNKCASRMANTVFLWL